MAKSFPEGVEPVEPLTVAVDYHLSFKRAAPLFSSRLRLSAKLEAHTDEVTRAPGLARYCFTPSAQTYVPAINGCDPPVVVLSPLTMVVSPIANTFGTSQHCCHMFSAEVDWSEPIETPPLRCAPSAVTWPVGAAVGAVTVTFVAPIP